MDLRHELVAYARFYERLRPRADKFVVATFERVTSRFDQVTEGLNERFGSGFAPFPHDDPSAVEQVFETLAAYDRSLGLADGRSAIPGQQRSERNARIRSRLEEPRYSRLVRECKDVCARFAALERVASAPVGAG